MDRPVSSSCTALERKMVGPGASEIVLDLTTMDGASVFIFSVIFHEVGVLHLAFDTDALTNGFALVSPAIFNVIALH